MGNPDELALVIKALKSGIGGCVEWQPKEADRVRGELQQFDLSPEGIAEELILFVRNGGAVRQVNETRPNRSHRNYYYRRSFRCQTCSKRGCLSKWNCSTLIPTCPKSSW